MDLNVESAVFALKEGQVLTLDDAAGTSLFATCGMLWVTEEGEFEDFVIGRGERLVIASSGRTLVQAMQPSWISIRPDAATH